MDHSFDTALRAAPGSEPSRSLRGWLEGLDEARWKTLMPALREIAAEVAPSARGVLEPDDVLGELVVLAYERWLPRYRDELRHGTAAASLRSYLKLRLNRHVAELRRKGRRRRELLADAVAPSAVPDAEPILVGRTGEPFSDAAARELMRKASRDKTLRAVLALKYAGFTQEEIASYLEVSRPTVSRRLATLAATLTVLLALAGIATWWFSRAEDAPHITPDREIVAATPQPAGPGPASSLPPSAPTAPAEPENGLTPEQIRTVVNRRRREVQACFDPSRESGVTRINAELNIVPAGTVSRAQVTGGRSEELSQCVARVVRASRFPRSSSATTTSIPFVFTSPEPNPQPAPEPDLEPAPGPEPFATVEQRALECTQRGDNQCVVRVLEGRARTERSLAMLIEAYRAQGRQPSAVRHIRTYVQRWPNTARARAYQQILSRQGG